MINNLWAYMPTDWLTDGEYQWFISQRSLYRVFFLLLLFCVLVLQWPILIYIILYNYLSVARRHLRVIFYWVALVLKVSGGQTGLSCICVCVCVIIVLCTVAVVTVLCQTKAEFNMSWLLLPVHILTSLFFILCASLSFNRPSLSPYFFSFGCHPVESFSTHLFSPPYFQFYQFICFFATTTSYSLTSFHPRRHILDQLVQKLRISHIFSKSA